METERRFYLTNQVDVQVRSTDGGEVYFEVRMTDAWVWDMYRQARFVKNVRVLTFKDVNVEELAKPELQVPDAAPEPVAPAGPRERVVPSPMRAPPSRGCAVSQRRPRDGAARAVRARAPGSGGAAVGRPTGLVRAKDALGRYGEDARRATPRVDDGFVVLERNWRCDQGELDIVARDGDVLVVCEVKTRSRPRHGSPFEAVTERKLHRLERLGLRWMRERGVRPAIACASTSSRSCARRRGRTVIEHVRGLS